MKYIALCLFLMVISPLHCQGQGVSMSLSGLVVQTAVSTNGTSDSVDGSCELTLGNMIGQAPMYHATVYALYNLYADIWFVDATGLLQSHYLPTDPMVPLVGSFNIYYSQDGVYPNDVFAYNVNMDAWLTSHVPSNVNHATYAYKLVETASCSYGQWTQLTGAEPPPPVTLVTGNSASNTWTRASGKGGK